MDIFTSASGFNVLARAARSGSNNLCGWLPEMWSQEWSTFSEVEIQGNTKAQGGRNVGNSISRVTMSSSNPTPGYIWKT